jgi:putative ABC transport system permease protein
MKDAFLLVYRNIRERKTRSILTMLGVVVGIAAVIAIMSISYGMEESITEQLSEMADLIIVRPGKMSFETGYMELGSFTDRDLEDVERIDGVKKAAGMVGGMQEVEYRGEKVMVNIAGTEPRDFGAVFGERIVKHEEGRDLRDNDRKVCEIGYSIAHDYFDYEIGVNDRITINGSKFRVVGVLEEQGGFRSNVDSQIYVTKSDALDIFNTKDIATIFVRVEDISEAEGIATEIEERIDDNHKLDDFSTAMTMGSAVESLEDIFQMLQVFLVADGSGCGEWNRWCSGLCGGCFCR